MEWPDDRAPCGRLARWQHRGRRMVDVEQMWRVLLARADDLDEARLAWEVFLLQRTQAHWHCPCGAPIRELFRTVIVQVAP